MSTYLQEAQSQVGEIEKERTTRMFGKGHDPDMHRLLCLSASAVLSTPLGCGQGLRLRNIERHEVRKAGMKTLCLYGMDPRLCFGFQETHGTFKP